MAMSRITLLVLFFSHQLFNTYRHSYILLDENSQRFSVLVWNFFHDLRIRSTVTLPTELRGRTEKVGDDYGGESQRRESKGTYECCAA